MHYTARQSMTVNTPRSVKKDKLSVKLELESVLFVPEKPDKRIAVLTIRRSFQLSLDPREASIEHYGVFKITIPSHI